MSRHEDTEGGDNDQQTLMEWPGRGRCDWCVRSRTDLVRCRRAGETGTSHASGDSSHEGRSSYENESTADCLAGAFAKQADRDGSLEKGDVEEAFYGMSLSGDPTPEPTGNWRHDEMVQRRIALQSHGTKEQRTENFRSGLNGGPHACLAEL